MANAFDYAKLVETKLWKYYEGKSDDSHRQWIRDVYNNAIKQLSTIRDTFSNYTLHDETHVINVMESMAGLLGDQINMLTVGETELLILAACLHDIGMAYTPEEKAKWLKKTDKCDEFIRKSDPGLIDTQPEDWNDSTKQNYFRWLHPFRVSEVLGQAEWSQIFGHHPKDIVSKKVIISVCQAHGEELSDLNLSISRARDIDTLFCAMMLRISDLLDFDDSRAPQILYRYAEKNMKSQKEWDKHISSIGFTYPSSPSTTPLPYAAECPSPEIEHSVRNFLNWVDDELFNCRKMQNRFHERWRNFPIPYEVDKCEIESVNYESGDFKLTMDQEQIINLLTGENLYESNAVFVRELLQNSIDATLLRGKIDYDFQVESEEARIDLWEWYDNDGNLWFRIDDRGTGMTKGMLEKYFLKIGNSYYNSTELKRDMSDHRQNDYHAISRFGIGFLSCFLCGTKAEISTLYFDPEKNKRENKDKATVNGYGIRMNITGITGYCVVQNQASDHIPNQPFPTPRFNKVSVCKDLEMDNYRQKPGTSIAIQIDPGKLGGIKLCEAVQHYLCCPRMPIYYNGERIGQTFEEFKETLHDIAGTHFYEISDQDKEMFGTILQGHYPQIAVTITPVDMTEDHLLDGLSGVIVEYKLQDLELWLTPTRSITLELHDDCIYITLSIVGHNRRNSTTHITMVITLDKTIYQLISYICSKTTESQLIETGGIVCAYQGILAAPLGKTNCNYKGDCVAIIFLEGPQQPKVDIGRTKISELNLPSVAAICALFYQLGINIVLLVKTLFNPTLLEWRALRQTPLGNWLSDVLKCNSLSPTEASSLLEQMKHSISQGEFFNEYGISLAQISGNTFNNNFILAYFQDTYELTIDYMRRQTITFSNKDQSQQTTQYDLFPPMVFCKSRDDDSRQYLCCRDVERRNGITADHPYTQWLLKNAVILNCYFNRQFKQIVSCLCNENTDLIIRTLNAIRDQLCHISKIYGMDMDSCPELTERDFR